ncbi:MAG: hypothetical protein FVQ84_08495 [Planctomycetes bacterium]|nr:hypothetical protein [Planctomycetota bacterium]
MIEIIGPMGRIVVTEIDADRLLRTRLYRRLDSPPPQDGPRPTDGEKARVVQTFTRTENEDDDPEDDNGDE